MKSIILNFLGKLPKVYCIYFCLALLIVAILFLVCNLRNGKESQKDTAYTRINLVCIAFIIISIIALAAIWRWWV